MSCTLASLVRQAETRLATDHLRRQGSRQFQVIVLNRIATKTMIAQSPSQSEQRACFGDLEMQPKVNATGSWSG